MLPAIVAVALYGSSEGFAIEIDYSNEGATRINVLYSTSQFG